MKCKVTLSFGDKETMVVNNITTHENVVDVTIFCGYIRVDTDTGAWTYATDSLVGVVTKPMEDDT